MFEKEAEDFADSKKSFWRQGKTCIESVIQAYQKGAEFGFQKGIKARINTTTISDCPIKDEEAKNIIQELLDNSDEYARQRAIDFLKEVK